MKTNPGDLPLYQCHKQVRASKIQAVSHIANALIVANGAVLDVSPAYLEKHKPEVGGYFVVYEDGYQSYSPAPAFESGYTLA